MQLEQQICSRAAQAHYNQHLSRHSAPAEADDDVLLDELDEDDDELEEDDEELLLLEELGGDSSAFSLVSVAEASSARVSASEESPRKLATAAPAVSAASVASVRATARTTLQLLAPASMLKPAAGRTQEVSRLQVVLCVKSKHDSCLRSSRAYGLAADPAAVS